MKVVTYNIQYGLGKDTRYDLARIASEVKDADIIALQEVDRHWQRSGCVDSPAVLASHLPEHHWVYGANLDMDASYRDPAGELVNRRRQFGTMILSRPPIVSSRNHLLPKYGTLTQHSIQQGALEVVIVTERVGPVRIYSVHLSHLSPAARMPQIEALLDIHARAPAEGGAWCGGHPDPAAGWTEGEMPPMPADALLMGDFNFEWSAPEYDRLVGHAHGAIRPPQSTRRLRRRMGRGRSSRRRRRDQWRRPDRFLLRLVCARQPCPILSHRYQHSRFRSSTGLGRHGFLRRCPALRTGRPPPEKDAHAGESRVEE